MKNIILPSILIALHILMSSCANTLDVVEGGHPLGVFEPKNDYVVDIPMKSQTIEGHSKGVKILGLDFLTFGADYRAQGVALGSRGENTLNAGGGGGGASSGSASTASTIINLGGTMVSTVLAPLSGASTTKNFKAAALRSACEANNCDVIGYPMYNVDTKNYILWKTYKVKVKGFPGKVQGVETVPRQYDPRKDTYWRTPLRSPANDKVSRLDSIEQRANALSQRLKELEANQALPVNFLSQADSGE